MRTLLVVFSLLLASTPALSQELLKPNDPLPPLVLKDQHDKPGELPQNLRQVLFTADMGGTDLVTKVIESRGGDWLDRTGRVFLADIHKMPGFIASMVAIPQLREKPYRIFLGREEADFKALPRQKSCVTVASIKDGRAADIAFACTEEALRSATER